jgi:hypothetical protein
MDILAKVRAEFALEKRPDDIVLQENEHRKTTLGDICRFVVRELRKETSIRKVQAQREYEDKD